jgi:tellurite resistance protein
MEASDRALIRSLIAMAWADGKVAEEERALIDAIIESFAVSVEEAAELRQFGQEPRTLDDVPLNDLDHGSRRRLLQLAVMVSYVDGDFDETERALLSDLAHRLDIPLDERAALLEDSARRAKGLLRSLQA